MIKVNEVACVAQPSVTSTVLLPKDRVTAFVGMDESLFT